MSIPQVPQRGQCWRLVHDTAGSSSGAVAAALPVLFPGTGTLVNGLLCKQRKVLIVSFKI